MIVKMTAGLTSVFFILLFAIPSFSRDNPQFIQGKNTFDNKDGKTAVALLLTLADSSNPAAQYMVACRMYEMGSEMHKGIKSNLKT